MERGSLGVGQGTQQPVIHILERHLDSGQRRTQFIRDVRDEGGFDDFMLAHPDVDVDQFPQDGRQDAPPDKEPEEGEDDGDEKIQPVEAFEDGDGEQPSGEEIEADEQRDEAHEGEGYVELAKDGSTNRPHDFLADVFGVRGGAAALGHRRLQPAARAAV
jgi:hypothetical protein